MELNDNTKNESSNSVDKIISILSQSTSGSIDLINLFEGLFPPITHSELKRLRNWALTKGCAAKEFDRAARNWQIKSELGRIPHHERDFVDAFTKSHGITAGFDGSLNVPRVDGDFAIDYSRANLERDALLTNARLKAGFDKSLIRPAIDQWFDDAKQSFLAEVWQRIDDHIAPRCEREWLQLIKAVVDTEAVSAGYAIAVLRKLIWQVKRKMKGYRVSHHLMPVWTGPQGNGKSTLTQRLLEPVRGCERRVNFAEITDGRNIEMWSSYVLFADEMEKAAKADIEAIKNVITATTLSRRILGTSNMAQVTQNATLIGATNGTLGSNIRDSTGLRRFAPIPTLRKPGRPGRTVDWEAINSIDFAALWRSVQIDDPDPMSSHIDELEQLQEDEREKSPVELWLEGLDLQQLPAWDYEKDGSIKAEKLFAIFREFEQQNCPGAYRLSSQAWGRDMKRLLYLDAANAKFSRKRAGDGWRYVPAQPIWQPPAEILKLRELQRKAS